MKAKNFVFGLHAVEALLKKNAGNVSCLYIQQQRNDLRLKNIIRLAQIEGIKTTTLSRDELDNLVSKSKHQGVIAEAEKVFGYQEHDLEELLDSLQEPPFLLILDEVQDPHNLGACLRSANAAGVHCVIAPKDNAASITPVVRKVACGAAETTPFIQVTNLARTLRMLKERGVWLFGAADTAEKIIYQTDLAGPMALVLGAEGIGMRRLTREQCDTLISIPMYGDVSSLNVSVATGVCLFEAVRQRKAI